MSKEAIKHDGVVAYQQGKLDSECPYPSDVGFSEKRCLWMTGYWAAHVVGHVSCAVLKEQLKDMALPSSIVKA